MKIRNNIYLPGMNFLAHAYLSFGRPEVLVGNLIADFVHGSAQLGFAPRVRTGIRLHRAIDAFTDAHAATRRAKALMTPSCGRYSGVCVDIIYDHFLASDPAYFSTASLFEFARRTYGILDEHAPELPSRFREMFFYMREHDWLYGYRLTAHIEGTFSGVYRRAKFLPDSGPAFEAFMEQYGRLQSCYADFIPEVVAFATESLSRLSKETG
jgi:acyl carrier protein phosphodiesterase